MLWRHRKQTLLNAVGSGLVHFANGRFKIITPLGRKSLSTNGAPGICKFGSCEEGSVRYGANDFNRLAQWCAAPYASQCMSRLLPIICCSFKCFENSASNTECRLFQPACTCRAVSINPSIMCHGSALRVSVGKLQCIHQVIFLICNVCSNR